MQNCSFENRCSKRVIWACKCTNPSQYFCDSHISSHMRVPGDHLTECMIVELSRNQIAELLPKLKEFTKYLEGCRKSIMDNSNMLMKCIEEEARKALNRIQDLQKTVLDLMSERGVNKENYRRIQCFPFEGSNDIGSKIENTKKTIEGFYEFDDHEEIIWEESNEIIFPRDPTGGLQSIYLDTFKLSTVAYAPKIGQYCHACKIDQNTYFIHGGRINNNTVSEAYLINIKDKKYETLTNGPTKDCGGGTVSKTNKVYIFGGYNTRILNTCDTCDTFDLVTKEWRSITALPQASHCITAGKVDETIILSGYEMSCCYSYNDSSFSSILTLPPCKYKFVCGGWIYTNSILYENQDQSCLKWTSHSAISWNNDLWISCAFKKNQYIYFIDSGNFLLRIDTRLKKVEKIAFT